MIRAFGMGCFWIATLLTLAQEPPKRLTFAVASVKRNPSGERFMTGTALTPDGVNTKNASVAQFLSMAFGDRAGRLEGGPSWLRSEKFDIEAKASGPVTREQIQVMLQNLLADRFRMDSHFEDRPTNVFALVLAKGDRKFSASPGPEKPGCRMDTKTPILIDDCKAIPISSLVRLLSMHNDVQTPVVDFTGLEGLYDIYFEYTPLSRMETDPGTTIFQALHKVGLDLERRKVPLTYLVIDHLQMPDDN